MANKQAMIKDPDLAKVGIALKRAAAKARQLGFDTNTPVYVFREGKIVDIVAEHRAKLLQRKASPKVTQPKKNKTQSQPRQAKRSR